MVDPNIREDIGGGILAKERGEGKTIRGSGRNIAIDLYKLCILLIKILHILKQRMPCKHCN